MRGRQYKYTLVALMFAIIFTCCENEIELTDVGIEFQFTSHGSQDWFAGLPIMMWALGKNELIYDGDYLWLFGDGQQSDQKQATHTYQFPGQYKVTLVISVNGGKKISKDTTLTILPRLKTFGNTQTAENGIYLFQNSNQDYMALYSYYSGSSDLDYFLLRLSSSFEQVSNHELPIEISNYAPAPVINHQNNLIVVSNFLTSFWSNASIKFKEQVTGPVNYGRVLKTPDGFCLTADVNQSIYINYRNEIGQWISTSVIDVSEPGYSKVNSRLDWPDLLSIHYTKDDPNFSGNTQYKFVQRKISGEVSLEVDLAEIPAVQSVKLTDGELLVGSMTDAFATGIDYYVFTKLDGNGNAVWIKKMSSGLLYSTYYLPWPVSVFESEGFVFIFYDNMRGLKIAENGTIVWQKRFTLSEDTFQGAIKNQSGNFVLLGSHQFDYETKSYTTDYRKRDLLLVEIDKNGNIMN